MAVVSLALFGCFEARLPQGNVVTFPKKTRALLAYLGLRPGHAYTRDHLAALLWGDTGDKQAQKSLRQAMYVLHRALPQIRPPILLAASETIALDPRSVEVDVAAFERLLAEGTQDALEAAARLYHGDLLEGFNVNEASFEEWLTSERERLRELALQAFRKLLHQQSSAGQTDRAVQTAVKLLGLDPLQEDVHRTLMRLYAAHGRRGAALKQYQVCVATLRHELGAEPESETKQLYLEIRRRPTESDSNVGGARQPRLSHIGRRHLHVPKPSSESELPLVGREAELTRLCAALDAAAAGHGQVVAIVGEAGIGKTRLLNALAADAWARGMPVLRGQSYESEQVLAFGSWVEALRYGHLTLDLDLFDGVAPVRQEALAHLVPELIGTRHDPTMSPPDHLQLFEAVTELVRQLGARQPTVVMLEDVHWADEMSGRLIAFLARRIRTSRVLLGVTIRDDELGGARLLRRVVDELSREPHFVQLTLSRLTRSDTAALVQSMTGDGSQTGTGASMDERIWRASEGNPFMAVETIHALQEGSVPRTATTLLLPERVRRIVAGRLERLSKRARHVASVAAVIGRECDFALLQRAAKLDDAEAAERVEELVRRRVLHGLGERFDFTHEQIRQVAYAELLQPRRKLLHIQVAHAIEGLYSGRPEHYHATLAAHYRQGEMWEKALANFRFAGVRAMRLSAYREATTCFEQALDALAHLPETRATREAAVDIRFELRNCLLPLAEIERIRVYLEDAERLARKLDDLRRLGWVSVYLSHHLRTAGRPTEASTFADTARGLAEAVGDPALSVEANLSLGAACLSLGDYRRAPDLFRNTLQLLVGHPPVPAARRGGAPAVLARAYLAQVLAELGEFEEGMAWGEAGVAIAEQLDDPFGLAYACLRLGRLHRAKGEFDVAVPLLERSCQLSRRWQITSTSSLATADLGHVYALVGRITEGLELLREAMSAYERPGGEAEKPRLRAHLGEACLLAGQFEEARAHAEQSLAASRARGERGYTAWALLLLGEIASHAQDVDASEASLSEAMMMAIELGMRPLVARCHASLAQLYLSRGKDNEAREHEETASRLFPAMHMDYWLNRNPVLT